jgi:type VI secretion system protein ImpE
MSAEQLVREGKLDEALAQLQQEVRGKPADSRLRVFLFQLLAVQGNWQRALTQLSVVGEMDAATLPMVQTYREAVQCELLRNEVFAGKRTPVVFGQPEEWVALLTEALRLDAAGSAKEAAALREKALEAAPATSGGLTLETRRTGPDPETSEAAFEWLADADSRLGPLVEAVVHGRYYWIPQARIQQIDLDPPADLRDFVWMPAHFTWANGGTAVGLIPSRYPGSEQSADPLIRLGRATDWVEAAPGTFFGVGQRMLATDGGEHALLDLRQIRFDVDPAAEPPAAGSPAGGQGVADDHG